MLVLRVVCVQPGVIEQLLCRAPLFRPPLDDALDKLDEHCLLLAADVRNSLFKTKVFVW